MRYESRMNSKVNRANDRFNVTSNRMLPINRAYDRRGGIVL